MASGVGAVGVCTNASVSEEDHGLLSSQHQWACVTTHHDSHLCDSSGDGRLATLDSMFTGPWGSRSVVTYGLYHSVIHENRKICLLTITHLQLE